MEYNSAAKQKLATAKDTAPAIAAMKTAQSGLTDRQRARFAVVGNPTTTPMPPNANADSAAVAAPKPDSTSRSTMTVFFNIKESEAKLMKQVPGSKISRPELHAVFGKALKAVWEKPEVREMIVSGEASPILETVEFRMRNDDMQGVTVEFGSLLPEAISTVLELPSEKFNNGPTCSVMLYDNSFENNDLKRRVFQEYGHMRETFDLAQPTQGFYYFSAQHPVVRSYHNAKDPSTGAKLETELKQNEVGHVALSVEKYNRYFQKTREYFVKELPVMSLPIDGESKISVYPSAATDSQGNMLKATFYNSQVAVEHAIQSGRRAPSPNDALTHDVVISGSLIYTFCLSQRDHD